MLRNIEQIMRILRPGVEVGDLHDPTALKAMTAALQEMSQVSFSLSCPFLFCLGRPCAAGRPPHAGDGPTGWAPTHAPVC